MTRADPVGARRLAAFGWLCALAACDAGRRPEPPLSESEILLRQAERHVDDACACRDQACTWSVMAKYTRWLTRIARLDSATPRLPGLNAEQERRFRALADRMADCAVRSQSAGSARPVDTARNSLEFGSADDVADILLANGVVAPALDCTNVAFATDPAHSPLRSVACTLPLPDAFAQLLARNVPLVPGQTLHASSPHAVYAGSCATRPGLGPTDERVEVLVGKNTKVTNGVERIELHIARRQGLACIEITYPWSS
jgi:hypothetical protein